MKHIYIVHRTDEYLEHFGIKGMEWGKKNVASNAIEKGVNRVSYIGDKEKNIKTRLKKEEAEERAAKIRENTKSLAASYKKKAQDYRSVQQMYEIEYAKLLKQKENAMTKEERDAIQKKIRDNLTKSAKAQQMAILNEKKYEVVAKKSMYEKP